MASAPATVHHQAGDIANEAAAMGEQSGPGIIEQKVVRLSAAAGRRVVEPDEEVKGSLGAGQVLPDELLSVSGLGLRLTPDQAALLSREEVASITAAGIRFEAVLEAGFAAHIATAVDLTDPRITFILHEMGEETRHQRLFQRLLSELDAKATSPFPARLRRFGYRAAVEASIGNPAFFYVLVLAGEEIPDLFQKRASEHAGTDGFIRAVNKYHRMEEARHLSFARAVFGEVWTKARLFDRLLVRHVAPHLIRFMFDSMVDPGVYATIGLPAMATWRAAKATPQRQQFRHEATRPVLGVLVEAGALKRGRNPFRMAVVVRPAGRRRSALRRQNGAMTGGEAAPSPVVRRRVVISGRVQGVFFRESCRQQAGEQGLAGSVRNLEDGTVEAVFEGPPDAVGRLVEWCRGGPRHAVVESVAVFDSQPIGESSFQVR